VPDVRRGIRRPGDVDLRDGTERTLASDAHFETTLDLALDLAFHRKASLKRLFELPIACGSARKLAGECQTAGRRNDDRVNTVANRCFQRAVVVFELVEVDDRFALAADVDERDVVTKADDRSFNGLALFVLLRLG